MAQLGAPCLTIPVRTEGQRHPEPDDGNAHGDGYRHHALVLDEVDYGHVIVVGPDVVEYGRVTGDSNQIVIRNSDRVL